jgi:hypothetical protein
MALALLMSAFLVSWARTADASIPADAIISADAINTGNSSAAHATQRIRNLPRCLL